MLTSEGADDAEILIRPSADGRWQIEMPSPDGVAIITLDNEQAALAHARVLSPTAAIRILPAVESSVTLHDDQLLDDAQKRTT
jgi:hypothetical protein